MPEAPERARSASVGSTSCDTVGAMKRSVREIAEAVGARLVGDGDATVGGVASIASASPDDLVFVADEKHLADALQSLAGAVIAGEFASASSTNKPLLISAHPKLTFARAARWLYEQSSEKTPSKENSCIVHTTAIVSAAARLGAGVLVEARAVVAERAEIGEGTIIGAGAVVGREVKIGSGCRIYPQVTIYPGTIIGDRVIVHAGAVLGSDGFGYVRDGEDGQGAYEKFPQVGRLVIEDDVEIGANT